MNIKSLSVEALERALAVKQQIAALEAELAGILSGASAGRPGRKPGLKLAFKAPGAGKKIISEEGRRRISEAQKARWAKLKAQAKASAKAAAPSPKHDGAAAKKGRVMTPELRARIAEAVKAKWAERKAAQ